MDKISSLLEESSEASLDPFTSSKDFSKFESGVVPEIPKSRGLAETSVSRTSGFYSIQKSNRKERPLDDVKLAKETKIHEPRAREISGAYSITKKDNTIRSEQVSPLVQAASTDEVASQSDPISVLEERPAKSKVTGSYQFAKSDARAVRTEEVSLAKDVSAPRPAKRRFKDRLQEVLGRNKKSKIDTSSDEWFGDKPEGDQYWTVVVDDSQREDTSIWTLFSVFIFLTLLTGVLLWLLLS